MALPGTSLAAVSDAACQSSPGNDTCNGAYPGSNCWNAQAYQAPLNNPDSASWNNGVQSYTTTLWYSPSCGTNWAVTINNNRTPLIYSTKVRRLAGADGGYLMMHGTDKTSDIQAVSPMVYSPDNLAQACLSLPSNDQAACTAAH